MADQHESYYTTVTLNNGRVVKKRVPIGWVLLGPDECIQEGDRIAYRNSGTMNPFDDWDYSDACDAWRSWAHSRFGRMVGNDEFRVIRQGHVSLTQASNTSHGGRLKKESDTEHDALLRFFTTPVGEWKGWRTSDGDVHDEDQDKPSYVCKPEFADDEIPF